MAQRANNLPAGEAPISTVGAQAWQLAGHAAAPNSWGQRLGARLTLPITQTQGLAGARFLMRRLAVPALNLALLQRRPAPADQPANDWAAWLRRAEQFEPRNALPSSIQPPVLMQNTPAVATPSAPTLRRAPVEPPAAITPTLRRAQVEPPAQVPTAATQRAPAAITPSAPTLRRAPVEPPPSFSAAFEQAEATAEPTARSAEPMAKASAFAAETPEPLLQRAPLAAAQLGDLATSELSASRVVRPHSPVLAADAPPAPLPLLQRAPLAAAQLGDLATPKLSASRVVRPRSPVLAADAPPAPLPLLQRAPELPIESSRATRAPDAVAGEAQSAAQTSMGQTVRSATEATTSLGAMARTTLRAPLVSPGQADAAITRTTERASERNLSSNQAAAIPFLAPLMRRASFAPATALSGGLDAIVPPLLRAQRAANAPSAPSAAPMAQATPAPLHNSSDAPLVQHEAAQRAETSQEPFATSPALPRVSLAQRAAEAEAAARQSSQTYPALLQPMLQRSLEDTGLLEAAQPPVSVSALARQKKATWASSSPVLSPLISRSLANTAFETAQPPAPVSLLARQKKATWASSSPTLSPMLSRSLANTAFETAQPPAPVSLLARQKKATWASSRPTLSPMLSRSLANSAFETAQPASLVSPFSSWGKGPHPESRAAGERATSAPNASPLLWRSLANSAFETVEPLASGSPLPRVAEEQRAASASFSQVEPLRRATALPASTGVAPLPLLQRAIAPALEPNPAQSSLLSEAWQAPAITRAAAHPAEQFVQLGAPVQREPAQRLAGLDNVSTGLDLLRPIGSTLDQAVESHASGATSEPEPNATTSASSQSAGGAPPVDIEALAQKVYEHLRRRLRIDQERLGRY